MKTKTTSRTLVRLLLLLALPCLSACSDDGTPDNSERQLVYLETFDAADVPEDAECTSVADVISLTPERIRLARATAIQEGTALASELCLDLFSLFNQVTLDELTTYEEGTVSCIEDGVRVDRPVRIELYGAAMLLHQECRPAPETGLPTTPNQVVRGEPSAWGGRLDRVPAAPQGIDVEIDIACTTASAACCTDRNCCLGAGGGEGYCAARFGN